MNKPSVFGFMHRATKGQWTSCERYLMPRECRSEHKESITMFACKSATASVRSKRCAVFIAFRVSRPNPKHCPNLPTPALDKSSVTLKYNPKMDVARVHALTHRLWSQVLSHMKLFESVFSSGHHARRKAPLSHIPLSAARSVSSAMPFSDAGPSRFVFACSRKSPRPLIYCRSPDVSSWFVLKKTSMLQKLATAQASRPPERLSDPLPHR